MSRYVAAFDEEQLAFAVKDHAVACQRGCYGEDHSTPGEVSQLLPRG